MSKKIVSVVIISALVVTMGAFSVFASTSSGSQSSNDVTITYNWYASQPVIEGGYKFQNGYYHITDSSGHLSSSVPGTLANYFSVRTSYNFEVTITNFASTSKQVSQLDLVLTTLRASLPSNISMFSSAMQNFTFDSNDGCIVYSKYDADNKIELQIRGSNMAPLRMPPYKKTNVFITFDIVETFYSSAAVPTFSMTQVANGIASSSVTMNYGTILDIANSAVVYNDSYNLQRSANATESIRDDVQAILDAYTSNSQNAQAVTSGTQSNEQTISTIGTNEDTWFTQNNQALQATGITNFNYTPTIMSGMSVISDQFNQLWLAIGDWNFVYTFSMMLGLVVLILRHNPQRRKSSTAGGGKSNDSSS